MARRTRAEPRFVATRHARPQSNSWTDPRLPPQGGRYSAADACAGQRPAHRPIGVWLRSQIGLEDRHYRDLRHHLRHANSQARYAQRAELPHLLLGKQHLPHRLPSVGTGVQIPRQFPEPLPHAAHFDAGDRFPVHPGSPAIPAHGLPRGTQDVLPPWVVAQRVEAGFGFSLRFRMFCVAPQDELNVFWSLRMQSGATRLARASVVPSSFIHPSWIKAHSPDNMTPADD